MFDIHRVELDWGGRKLVLEAGKIARQADGAVVADARPVAAGAALAGGPRTAPRRGAG